MLWEVRVALRALARTPGYAAGAILTLGLSLGLVTTAFGLLSGALQNSGTRHALSLFLTERADGRDLRMRWPYPAIRVLRADARSFARLASYTTTSLNLVVGTEAARVDGEFVSPDYFDILAITPSLGRLPVRPVSGNPEQPAEVVISDRLWRRHFGGGPHPLGQTIRLAGVPLAVVGILKEGTKGLSGRADVWLPHTLAPVVSFADYFDSTEYFHSVIAEARPGVSREEAQAELSVIARRIAAAVPPRSEGATDQNAVIVSLREAQTDATTVRARGLVAAAAVLVLLIAGVNVANLAIARVTARRREFAVRLALGAGRWRVLRSVAVETALLASAGVGTALLLAAWGRDVVVGLVPPGLANPANDYAQLARFADLRIDWPVWSVVTALAAITTLAISALAVRALARLGFTTSLARSGAEGPAFRSRFERAIVPVQIAASVALVAVAGLLIRTVASLAQVDSGFRSNGVLTFSLAEDRAVDQASGPDLAARVMDAVSRAPGVEAVTVAQCPPTGSRCARLEFVVDGQPTPARPAVVGWHRVGPGHFRTLGIRLIGGREFTADDRRGQPPVVVINQALARRFFPDQSPIGRRVRLPDVLPGDPDIAEIVGIVGDVVYWPVDEPPGPDVYQPALQYSHAWMTVLARITGQPTSAIASIRAAVREVDPDLPMFDVASLDSLVRAGRADRRFVTVLLVTAALLSIVLAAVGVYGVTASWLEGRRLELAIRMALGAEPGGLVAMVMRSSLGQAAAGAAAGLLLAAGAGRVVRNLLFGVAPQDPANLAAAAGLMLAVVAGAAYLPARRAGRVDPLNELKAE